MVFNPLGVDADVPFHEVEARVVEETADRIRANIQAVDFVVIVFEQTFGQVVTDKTVHAEDQHAGTAFDGHHRRAGDQRPGHQPQRLRQLGALNVQTVVGLAGNDLQRLLAAAHNQRGDGDDGARFCRRNVVTHAGFPDDELADARKAVGARPRVGHGAHQVVQLAGRFVPVQTTIFRRAAAKAACLALVLCGFAEGAVKDARQRIAQQRLCRRVQLLMQLQRGIVRINSDLLLRHDSARIRTAHHAVQRHARFRFTVHQHPVQRGAATVGRQQRTMKIKGAFCSQA